MYTLLDDVKVAKKVNDFLTDRPGACRKEICVALNITKYRLHNLRNQGLIYLPPPVNRGRRWMMAEKYRHLIYTKIEQK